MALTDIRELADRLEAALAVIRGEDYASVSVSWTSPRGLPVTMSLSRLPRDEQEPARTNLAGTPVGGAFRRAFEDATWDGAPTDVHGSEADG